MIQINFNGFHVLNILYTWDITYSTIFLAVLIFLIFLSLGLIHLGVKRVSLIKFFEIEKDTDATNVKLNKRVKKLKNKIKKSNKELMKISLISLVLLLINSVSIPNKKESEIDKTK